MTLTKTMIINAKIEICKTFDKHDVDFGDDNNSNHKIFWITMIIGDLDPNHEHGYQMICMTRRIPYILTTSGLTTGRQFWGRQSWVYQLYKLTTLIYPNHNNFKIAHPNYSLFLCSLMIWVMFWGHQICFQECLIHKIPIWSCKQNIDKPDFWHFF